MTSHRYRALALGAAVSFLALNQYSWAQQAQPTAQTAEEQEAAIKQGRVILLETIDVGAGAEGSTGTDIIAVDKEEMDRKKPSDLADVFAGEPQVAVGGAIASTQKIYVNGIDENNLAVTVDGSRQNNKVFHHNGTYLLDPALLKAVTVQAGVAPADAGPAALGGSMGFETKDAADLLQPGDNFGGFVTGSWDSNSNAFTTGLSLFGMQDGFEYLGYINYGNGGNYKAGNGEEMLGTGTDLLAGLAKVAYESTEGHRFELSHEQVRDDDLRPYRANVYINIRREPVLREYDLNRQNTVFTYTNTSAEGWLDPKIVLAYSKTSVETPVFNRATGVLLAPALGETSSLNGKIENKFKFDLGSVTAGIDFYDDKASLDYNAVPPEFPDESASNVGLYMQARLEPTDVARVSFGFRGDAQRFTGANGEDFTNSGLSGNISGEYDIVPEFLTLKAGASHVWGGIPLAENFIQNPAWTYAVEPVPVKSNNVTAGFVATYEALTFEANVFRTEISNARFPSTGNASRSYDVDTWGWEAGATYDFGAGFVRAKYADVRGEVDGLIADSEVGRYMTTPIGKIIMLGAGYTFDDWGLTIGSDVEIALKNSSTLFRHPTDPTSAKRELPGYEVVNAFIEYTPVTHSNFTLRADVKNIFDEDYTSRASYGQDFDGVKAHLEPGRTFKLSATARF